MARHVTKDTTFLTECSNEDATKIKDYAETGTSAPNSSLQTIESSINSPVSIDENDNVRTRTENVSSAVNSYLNTRFPVEIALDGQSTSPDNTLKQLDNLITSGTVPGEIQPDSTSSLPKTSSQVPKNGHGNLRSLNQCSRTKPSNRALVVLQGQLSKNYLEQIEHSFRKMGFDRVEIFHQASGSITRHEFERKAASLTDDLKSVSNLILVICQGEYGGIELNTNFLIQQIYGPVARFNQQKEKEFKAAAKCNEHQDTRQYAGINLIVLLDGMDTKPLKYYVKCKGRKLYQCRRNFKWCKNHNFALQKNKVIGPVRNGQIVQFWVGRTAYGHSPFVLLNSLITSCLKGEHMNYLTFLQQIRSTLSERPAMITPTPSVRNANCSNVRGDKCISEVSCCVAKCVFKHLMKVIKQRICERDEYRNEQDAYRGDFILSSMCKFSFDLMLPLNGRH